MEYCLNPNTMAPQHKVTFNYNNAANPPTYYWPLQQNNNANPIRVSCCCSKCRP